MERLDWYIIFINFPDDVQWYSTFPFKYKSPDTPLSTFPNLLHPKRAFNKKKFNRVSDTEIFLEREEWKIQDPFSTLISNSLRPIAWEEHDRFVHETADGSR